MTAPGTEIVTEAGPDHEVPAQALGAATQTWPLAFDGHAGWLHVPSEGAAGDVGVVICAPLGRDARCAHAPLRRLAEQLAAAGVPTLRYDHLGTGDSLDLPSDVEDALPIWRGGVAAAAACLRRRTGAKRVVLAGLRFGATLAALAGDLAEGLVLLAPVVRGGGWLRELKLATAMLAPTTGGAGEGEGLDADGLALTPATAAAIGKIDLRGHDWGSVPILLAAQNSSVTAFGQAAALGGARIIVDPFPGFEALFEDSHSNQAPEAVFQRVAAWIALGFPSVPIDAKLREPTSDETLLFPEGAVERPVRFGAGLRGVLCSPAAPQARGAGRAVVFCNTGGDPRAGIGGFAAGAARALAREGVSSLRFDFAGLGDSPAGEGRAIHIYETPRGPDFGAALDLLAGEGLSDVTLAGICSGGHHALHAALDDPRVNGVLAVNTVVLAWRVGTSLAVGDRDQGRSTQAYLQRLKQVETWKRFLAGGLDVAAVLRTLRRRLKARREARSEAAPEAAVKARLAAMSARGGRLRMVVGQDDPALDMVVAHFGAGGARLKALPGLSLRVVPGLDHGLALSASRAMAQRELLAFVAEG
jgi:alpha/beta superfamily hydrolase